MAPFAPIKVTVALINSLRQKSAHTHLFRPKQYHGVQVSLHAHSLPERLACVLDVSSPVKANDISRGAPHGFKLSSTWGAVEESEELA